MGGRRRAYANRASPSAISGPADMPTATAMLPFPSSRRVVVVTLVNLVARRGGPAHQQVWNAHGSCSLYRVDECDR